MKHYTIALEPDIRLVERLTFLQEDLNKILTTRGADSRWCRPEHMHVPLLHLGAHEPNSEPEFNEILREVAREFPNFSMTMAGICAYPSPSCPRLIQVSASPREVLQALRTRLTDAFRAANLRFDGRAYEPVMLLGRTATRTKRVDITDAITAIQDLNFGQSDVFELVLLSATLDVNGASHHVVSRFFLASN